MTPNRLVLLTALITATGCDPAKSPPQPPPAERTAEPAPTQAPVEPSRATATNNGPPMPLELIAVRLIGDKVEIEVALDRPISPGGLTRPSLQIGDEVVQRSRAGEGGRLDRLVFTVPADQYERMPRGEGIVVRAGLVSNEDAPSKPRLADFPLTADPQ